ncbi:MAG: S-layer homology domain-containing protein [Oscillospiraceae bacterium]
MKKFLSLVLALTMMMSLVTINAGAAEFTDDEDITYDEAVAVISEIGVVNGYEEGDFKPQNGLTRQAAAKIICNLILGPTTAAELHADTAPFSDVPVSNDLSGYIAYCAKEGIISGYADGTFRPTNGLTGYAFMKMLLGALGYDATYEGYTGGNWSINVAKQAIGIGLNTGLKEEFNGVDQVTREEAALYAFNTLQATLVDYDQKITTNINGVDVTISQGNAKPVTWNNSNVTTGITKDGNIKNDNFVQFAEEYFPDLVAKPDSDDFERPATLWMLDKREIGTYVDWEKMVESYTTGVTGKDVFELLTGAVIDDNTVLRYVDGGLDKTFDEDAVLLRSNRNDLADTGKGALTEVYLDTDQDEIRIVTVNTWLAQATSDYNTSSELATVKIFDKYNADTMVTGSSTQSVDAEVVPAVAELKKDDYVLVNQSIKDRTKLEVVAIAEPELLEDCTVTAFSKTKEDQSSAFGADAKGLYESVTTSGEKYDGAVKAYYDASVLNEYDADLLKDSSYNLYLDPYGYVIGLDLYEGTKNYVFITGYNRTVDSNISIETSEAAAIFLDGTMKPITVNVKDTNKNIAAVYNNADYAPYFDSTRTNAGDALWVQGGEPNENKWYTYTVDNDVYTLKPVKQQSATAVADIPGATTEAGVTTGTIDCSRVYLPDSRRTGGAYAYGDDESVYLVVSQDAVDTTNDKAITDVDGVYTGVQDVKIEIRSDEINSHAATDLSATPKTYHVDPVYTVYNGDGYVIASVVLGEAQGATKNYAYILSGATMEKLEDGVKYWTFDAILGGKKVELTIQDKFGNTIQNLKPYSVQELIFTGDYVTKIEDISADDEINCALQRIDAGNDAVYDITFDSTNHGTATNKADYASSFQQNVDAGTAGTDNTTITLQTRTLWTTKMTGATQHTGDQDQPVGLAFAKDAPAVVIQRENGKKVTNEYASVDEALGAMADANTTVDGKQFRGRIVAVLNDLGVAEWVVFVSATPVVAGTGNTPSIPTDYTPVVTQNGTFLNVKAHTNDGDDMIVYAGAWTWLVENGYSVVNAQSNGSNWTFIATKGGQSYFFNTNLIPVSQIYVNGVQGWYEENATIANPAAANYGVYAASQTLPLSDPLTGSGTGNVRVAYASHDGKYVYTDLYKVTVGGAAKWYRNGDKITLTGGSHYSTTGLTTDFTNEPIPAGGLTVSSALSGATITTAWKVSVDGKADQYVTNTSSTSSLGLTASTTYRTTDGKYVTTDGSGEITNVTSDITITDITTTYLAVTLPDNGSASGLQYTIAGNDKTQYVANGGTLTVSITLNGTANAATPIKVETDTATVTATANPSVTPTGGDANGFTAAIASDKLTITPVSGNTVSGLTYSVTFTVTAGGALQVTNT